MGDLTRRTGGWTGPAGTALAVAGAVGLLAVTSVRPVSGYVSEAGEPGADHALVYRLSILAVAAAVALLAAAVRPEAPLAAVPLAIAAPFAAVSGAVTCSPGCPLPPYERPTAADLVHAIGSTVGLAWCGLAMLILALRAGDTALRRAGLVGTAVAVPLLAAAGASLVLAGRGTLTGVLERCALAATLAWLVAAGALVSRRGRARAP